MKIFIASDIYISEHEGKLYAKNQYSTILRRYFEAFGAFKLCCRRNSVDVLNADYTDITDWVTCFIPVEHLIKVKLRTYDKLIAKELKDCDLLIARCPGTLSSLAVKYARKQGKPYFAEIMGCPWDSLRNHSLLGKILAPNAFFNMKRVVKNADYALYVTHEFLQKRYPCDHETVGVSDVLIQNTDEQVLRGRLERIQNRNDSIVTLMTSAAVNVKYKGQEYVIRAIPLLNKNGIKVKYVMAGGGSQDRLRRIAQKCGVEDQVVFLGRQPLEDVFRNLDEADIYIQPSLQEGLPRAVVEAMSRGCPVVGARTGGIPELIGPECLVEKKSPEAIADAILSICSCESLSRLAEQNYWKAQEFRPESLRAVRDAYYDKVKREISRDDG